MNAQFGTLIERARSFTRDTAGSFIEDDDLAAWVNEAYKDIAARLQILQREVSDVTISDTIPMPSPTGTATYEVISLRLGSIDVEFVNADVFTDWRDSGHNPPTTLGHVFNGQIELYPTPAVGTAYTLRYAYVPADLVSPSDVHILPVYLERKLVEYAVAAAKYKDGQNDDGDRWYSRYEQGLPQLATGHETLIPGPIAFSPAESYFEADARAHTWGNRA